MALRDPRGAPPVHRGAPRPLPVSRAPHWRLECACGKVLSACGCQGVTPHVEVWNDGCAFVARWYGARPRSRTPAEAAGRGPVPRQPHPLQGREAELVALREAGLTLAQIATRLGVSTGVLHHRLKVMGITKRRRYRQ